MKETAKELATKGIALLVLLIAAYVLFKIVLGVIAGIVWTLMAIVALVGVIWALNRIL